ncbi:MAG: nuclear transport factor 2 family protein [Henriciella sp.]
MKSSSALIALALSILGLSSCQTETTSGHIATKSSIEQAALEVVQRRTAAYNAHDIDAFIATYADNVRIYEYPDKFLGAGTERMRAIFGPQFAEDDGTIVVHRQHALEHTVISDETVTFYGTTEHNIGIYTVIDGLIAEVRLVEPEE